jgi:hypothetical protein
MAELDITFTGKLAADCRSLLIDNVESIIRILRVHQETSLEINITKFHRKRTDAQNRWCWGYAIVTVRAWMLETTGEAPSKEALYTFFRVHIIGDEPVVETIDGVDIIVLKGKRFSQCTTVEFSERSEKIIAYYAEKGLELNFPDTESNNYMNSVEEDIERFCRKCGKTHAGSCNQIKDE